MIPQSYTASQHFDSSSKDTTFIAQQQPVLIPQGTDANLLGSTEHAEVLGKLLEQVTLVDFRVMVGLEGDEKLTRKHYAVCVVDTLIDLAKANLWGIGNNNGYIYIYNGSYWKVTEGGALQRFLGEAAERMGVEVIEARYFQFREMLYKQFLSAAYLPTPRRNDNMVLINLQNGTFEITPGKQVLREHRAADFLTYLLPFTYDPKATAPQFQRYLDTVLPDVPCQHILSEYMGYVFIHPSKLKLEKCLLLYGSGANGKSVFFEISNALLGRENVSSYSLQNLTKHDGYQRADLQNRLVNYASEINGKLEADIFKQLASGEPVEARQIYGEPFTMTHYAKLIFNGNELPKDVEHTPAYFRRFLILPFTVTIPEEQQDRELAPKIINSELSGIFNWVLVGLRRLLKQKRFTESDKVKEQLEEYKKESDSVLMFLEEEGYQKSTDSTMIGPELYAMYRSYCQDSGFRAVSIRKFNDRLKNNGFVMTRNAVGNLVYAKKISL